MSNKTKYFLKDIINSKQPGGNMNPLILYIWLDMTGTLDLYQQSMKFWATLLEQKAVK